MAKLELVFVLTQKNAFSQRFHFKSNRKSIDSSKNGTSDFQNSLPFERSACFYLRITENFERFQYFYFEKRQSFSRNQSTTFQLEELRLKTKHFHTKLPCQKTNRMESTKWTYHKEGSFAINHFIFLKILFQFKNLL